jgi:hypothetical protein
MKFFIYFIGFVFATIAKNVLINAFMDYAYSKILFVDYMYYAPKIAFATMAITIIIYSLAFALTRFFCKKWDRNKENKANKE